jgi:hypothetical protein
LDQVVLVVQWALEGQAVLIQFLIQLHRLVVVEVETHKIAV